MQFDVSFPKRYSVPRCLVISSSISSTSLTEKKIKKYCWSLIPLLGDLGGGGGGGHYCRLSLPSEFHGQFSKRARWPKALTLLYNFQTFWNSHLEWQTKQLNGPGNYRELRETGPSAVKLPFAITLCEMFFTIASNPWQTTVCTSCWQRHA